MDWNDIIVIFADLILLPLLAWGIKELSAYLKTRIQNDHAKKYLDIASDAVYNAVESTMQTFVSTMKKNGAWTKETAEEAFMAAKSTALLAMGAEAQKVITEVSGDLDIWLESKIEACIYEIKEQKVMA